MLNKQPQIKESEKETPAFAQADALIPQTEAQGNGCGILEVVSSEGVVTKEGLVGGGGMLIVPMTPRALHLSHTDRQREHLLCFFITLSHTQIQAFPFDYGYSMFRHVFPLNVSVNH